MSGRLSGTVALVTGASSGIGAATGRALAAEGADVALVARRAHRLEELAGEIETEGGRALSLPYDITDREKATEAVRRTVETLGRLDIVVNNAGLMLLGEFAGAPASLSDRMVELNIDGLLNISRAALPHLVEAAADGCRGVADLVNVSSVAGRKAVAGGSVYALTKYGVVGLSEGLRQELAGRQVRVTVVEPGGVDTELGDHITPEIRDRILKEMQYTPMAPSDIAEAIVFAVTRRSSVAVNELLVRPTGQLL
ncbi:SDR family NAD(P)-dependent oxidoreductase [Streptomyces sp. NPDC001817]|uniref:SDR family NAD(P)-dependent oxidoreductase n=1 Tax=Streptomyces sp. NPDC001817 TaxID=3154398 RepID=UPI003324D01D